VLKNKSKELEETLEALDSNNANKHSSKGCSAGEARISAVILQLYPIYIIGKNKFF
jgi:hypothetical protein